MSGPGPRQAKAARNDELTISSADKTHRFSIELAITPEQQRKGLMFRRQLAADHGMLFIYDPPRQIGMWMKNTYLSLDMLFARRDGTIFHIEEFTEPFSERVISPDGKAFAVFEVPAGTAGRLQVSTGDRIRHPSFGN